MEQEPTNSYLQEIAHLWQVYISDVEYWVDECNMPVNDFDKTAEWASKDNHMDLIMDAKRKFFEDSLFAGKLRPVLPETSA